MKIILRVLIAIQVLVLLAAPGGANANPGPTTASTPDPDALIREFASAYEADAMGPGNVTFGISLAESDRAWTITVAEQNGHRNVGVAAGMPPEPTFYFPIDTEATLDKVYRGQWAAMTAMGKAFSTDVAPMDIALMEGFEPDGRFRETFLPLTFHFWSRETPETVRFGDLANTRFVHGGHLTVFYYQPGIRLAGGFILPGEHVNEDELSRTNPFPSFVIMTQGEAIARVDGKDRLIKDGEGIFIGPGVSHEFLNQSDGPAQFVLVMFGEGA